MSRLLAVDPATATGRARELLDAARAQLGIAPNFLRVLAHSPAALESFLGLYGATSRFALDKATQERVALVVAESNRCSYCLSAHTAIGRGAGLSNDEMLANRHGRSADAKAASIVRFAARLNDETGGVSADEVNRLRDAGVSDGEVVEVIALVALNLFTNILNKSIAVDIDFPRVEPLGRDAPIAA